MGRLPQVTLDFDQVLRYYSQKDVQKALVDLARGREIGVRYANGAFGKRPDILQYPQDVVQTVKNGAISFNISEERWEDPLKLRPAMTQTELDNNRKGWDLILDIDCDEIAISKIAARLIIAALHYYRVPLTIKFSGRSGFHIAVPWESFPDSINQKETRILFPEIPRAVAAYLKSMIALPLAHEILVVFSIEDLQTKSSKPFSELAPNNTLDPFCLVEIDAVAISSRHLIRSCYSINEKTGLVSIPLLINEIEGFDPMTAAMGVVNVTKDRAAGRYFLENTEGLEKTGARMLFTQALDYAQKREIVVEDQSATKEFEVLEEAALEDSFPPCIKQILGGISDGRKRSSFILVNFLTLGGWSYEMIEARLRAWNKILAEPLREIDLLAALRQHRKKKGAVGSVLPPNCDNRAYYIDFGVCHPDALCKKIKNPVSYMRAREKTRKMQAEHARTEEEKKAKKKVQEEKKELREKRKTKTIIKE